MSNTSLVPLQDMQRMAEAIAKSGLFGMKTADQALALMIVAQAEGRHPGSVAAEYALLAGGGDQADRVRERMDKYVAELTREWLETARGAEWLGQKVEESLAEEIEQETERMAEARADQLAFRQEKAD